MPRPVAGQDANEFQIARQFVQFTRVCRNVYQSALMYGKLRKKTPDWAMDPKFVAHNADFSVWLREVPEDMQIAYPQDGSAPWIPSHMIANMHCYHFLSIVMHFRPQLHAVSDNYDGIWKQHMMTCYSAAKTLCKLQEGILKTYGMPGLLCMLRGISFHIYAVLTCTMLHLVSGSHFTPSNCTNSSGCGYLPRPRYQHGRQRFLRTAHAHPRDLWPIFPNARNAGTGQQSPSSILCRHHEAL
jgi:hypothetical protein